MLSLISLTRIKDVGECRIIYHYNILEIRKGKGYYNKWILV